MITNNALYICMLCFESTSHFNRVCINCEDPNGGDGVDD